MILEVTPDIIKLFDNDNKKLESLAVLVPYDVKVRVNLYPMRAAVGYTIYGRNRKNFTVSVHPRLTKARKKMVMLHEFSHIVTILKHGNKDIKSHGPEFFEEHKNIFYTSGKYLFSHKEYQRIHECFSVTTNYKQFNLCLKANFWTSVNSKAKNGEIFLVNASRFAENFVFSKKKYKILKKNSLYYTVACERNGSVIKLNKYVKVLPL